MADARNNSGTITADTQDVRISPNGRPVVAVELSGTWTATLDVKIKIDGTEQNATVVTGGRAGVALPLTANQIVFVDAVGVEQVIVRANGAVTGTAVVYLNATDGVLTSGGLSPFTLGGSPVKQAVINILTADGTGDHTVVALVAAKKIRLLNVTFVTKDATAISWKSGGGSTIVPAQSYSATGGLNDNRAPYGWVAESLAGEALVVNNSVATNIAGTLNYVEL